MTEVGKRALAGLNRRERAVLRQICLGRSSKEIAAILGIADQTVREYSHHIFIKTGTDNRLHLVIFCFFHGIVECPCGGAA